MGCVVLSLIPTREDYVGEMLSDLVIDQSNFILVSYYNYKLVMNILHLTSARKVMVLVCGFVKS